ncbi:MAG: hypothetical protein ACFFDW_02490 [Candidatus Thorarchaeota archaeon]
MKLSLSNRFLKKVLLGTTIVNYLLLVTYICHLISIFLFENYTIFLLSVPAYIMSNSWLLLVGFFGFEGLLIFYYWWKNKNSSNISNPVESTIRESNSNEEMVLEDFDILSEDPFELEGIEEESFEPEIIPQRPPPIKSSSNIVYANSNNNIFRSTPQIDEAELEFDKLWEDAINHVKEATSNNKKKAGEPSELLTPKIIDKEISESQRNKFPPINRTSNQGNNERLNEFSRAIKSGDMKRSISGNDTSIIKVEHREFYNEIAMNNWIYENRADREKIGIYKPSIDESRFRQKDINYLIDSGVLYKLTIPFPLGSFPIYSINEFEDKKIIKNYLASICKKNRTSFAQKTISIVNYHDLGLDKKIWRLDFQIKNDIFGLIWISDFLIVDEQTNIYSLTFEKKKELKALLATAQLQFSNKESTAVIITDYNESKDLISSFTRNLGLGKATVLAVGEADFEKEFNNLLK